MEELPEVDIDLSNEIYLTGGPEAERSQLLPLRALIGAAFGSHPAFQTLRKAIAGGRYREPVEKHNLV
jgi:hypothetical protein